MVAHERQLVAVPDDLTDEAAVLGRADRLRGARGRARSTRGRRSRVIGAGTLGLLTIAALRQRAAARPTLIATAKHPHQRTLAARARRRPWSSRPASSSGPSAARTGSMRSTTASSPAASTAVVDCVGSRGVASPQALRDRGARRHASTPSACPGVTTLDLTPLWHARSPLRGCLRLRAATDFDARHRARRATPTSAGW